MNVVDRIRMKNPEIGSEAHIGVWASFNKDVSVDTDNGNRDIIVVANTDDIDLENEVVVPSGASMDYFASNGKVFVDHDYSFGSAVGAVRKNGIVAFPSLSDQRGWKVRVGMLSLKGNPVPDDILTIAKEVGIGVSIGFEATDYGPPTDEEEKRYTGKGGPPKSVVRSWKWIELSFTAMPCNVACQSQAVVVDDSRAASLEGLVTKGLIQRQSARAMGLPERKMHAVAETPRAKRTLIRAGVGTVRIG